MRNVTSSSPSLPDNAYQYHLPCVERVRSHSVFKSSTHAIDFENGQNKDKKDKPPCQKIKINEKDTKCWTVLLIHTLKFSFVPT